MGIHYWVLEVLSPHFSPPSLKNSIWIWNSQLSIWCWEENEAYTMSLYSLYSTRMDLVYAHIFSQHSSVQRQTSGMPFGIRIIDVIMLYKSSLFWGQGLQFRFCICLPNEWPRGTCSHETISFFLSLTWLINCNNWGGEGNLWDRISHAGCQHTVSLRVEGLPFLFAIIRKMNIFIKTSTSTDDREWTSQF